MKTNTREVLKTNRNSVLKKYLLIFLSQEPFFSQDVTEEDPATYKRKLEDVPTTQAAIDIVKQDIKALETETKMMNSKQSNERRQIIYLGEDKFVNYVRNANPWLESCLSTRKRKEKAKLLLNLLVMKLSTLIPSTQGLFLHR